MRLRKLKKGLAILLTAAMVVGLVPDVGTLQVSAAEATEQQSTDEASVTINGETLYYATLEEAFSAAEERLLLEITGALATIVTGFSTGNSFVFFLISSSSKRTFSRITLVSSEDSFPVP